MPELTAPPVKEDALQVVLVTSVTASSGPPRQAASQTTLLNRVLGRAELMMLPFAIGASMAAPTAGAEYRHTLIRSKANRSIVRPAEWDEDAWFYTEEPAAVVEIQALNALLALPAREGSWLEFETDE
ncbi:MAG TPA: hypothetical protein VGO66_13105 [Solirubrobacterales bacterium]|jgi:hypothetical protein|nr:hypothetical protein [Solirubrobacterales bacterium]